LAAMIDYINTNRTCHIITIEDPIEFLIRDKRSIVNQREIGVDTNSFATALRAALRQDPDVILVGEMRDFETIQTALTAAEAGYRGRAPPAPSPRRRHDPTPRPALPAAPAAADPPPAREHHQGRHQPAPGPARRRQGPRTGGRDPGRLGARARVHRRPGDDQGAQRRHRQGLHDLRHAELRPVTDAPREGRPRYLPGNAPARFQPRPLPPPLPRP